jgi:integron integrase
MKNADSMARFEQWMRDRRLAYRTRQNYLGHVARYAKFKPSPQCQTTEDRISEFLSDMTARKLGAVSQKQALNAIVNLYKSLDKPAGTLPAWTRPTEYKRIPQWVTVREALALIEHLREPWDEVASMLIGSGLRIHECLALRVKDIDLDQCVVSIHRGKGNKDRVVPLARRMIEPLRRRIEVSRGLYREDRARNRPGVFSPIALKHPNSGMLWEWFWLWPAPGESTDPDTGIVRRHHRHEDGFAKALRVAVQRSGISKRVTAHAFRHGFATAFLRNGGTIQDLKELLGHAHLETTEVYTHCVPNLASRVPSPLDIPPDNITPFEFQPAAVRSAASHR